MAKMQKGLVCSVNTGTDPVGWLLFLRYKIQCNNKTLTRGNWSKHGELTGLPSNESHASTYTPGSQPNSSLSPDSITLFWSLGAAFWQYTFFPWHPHPLSLCYLWTMSLISFTDESSFVKSWLAEQICNCRKLHSSLLMASRKANLLRICWMEST